MNGARNEDHRLYQCKLKSHYRRQAQKQSVLRGWMSRRGEIFLRKKQQGHGEGKNQQKHSGKSSKERCFLLALLLEEGVNLIQIIYGNLFTLPHNHFIFLHLEGDGFDRIHGCPPSNIRCLTVVSQAGLQ